MTLLTCEFCGATVRLTKRRSGRAGLGWPERSHYLSDFDNVVRCYEGDGSERHRAISLHDCKGNGGILRVCEYIGFANPVIPENPA